MSIRLVANGLMVAIFVSYVVFVTTSECNFWVMRRVRMLDVNKYVGCRAGGIRPLGLRVGAIFPRQRTQPLTCACIISPSFEHW